MCKKCGTSIRANGERCIIFLLKNGEIQQIQRGKYDNYGCCEEHLRPDLSHNGESWHMGWVEACGLHFSPDDTNGFAVYHEACWKGELPIRRSKDDPEQGWSRLATGGVEDSGLASAVCWRWSRL